jgi:MATE family multidrug resistance protein
MLLVAVGYWFMPRLFVWPFLGDKMQEASELVSLVSKLLMFVAFYSLFDTCSIIFAGALKGAGDTRFVMMLSVGMSWLLMVLPAWLAVRYGWGPRGGLYVAWGFTTAYVCVLGLAFLGRFLQGKWQAMRVIEAAPHAIALELREPPTAVDAT